MYTNLYFVTFICTRTIRIDIFQRFLVMPEKLFYSPELVYVKPRLKPVPF